MRHRRCAPASATRRGSPRSATAPRSPTPSGTRAFRTVVDNLHNQVSPRKLQVELEKMLPPVPIAVADDVTDNFIDDQFQFVGEFPGERIPLAPCRNPVEDVAEFREIVLHRK